MRLIVTGGAGFIGSAVCRNLGRRPGWLVLNLDKLTYAGNLSSLAELDGHDAYRFVQADICDRTLLDELLVDFRPDAIIHLAAESHVDRSIAGSADFIRTNIVGTHTLLEASLAYFRALSDVGRDRFRFLHVSTDEVFGSLGPEGSFSEDDAYQPRSPYAASKAASDHLASAWGHTYGLPVMISNCSNNYGPFQFPEKLIPLAVINALEGRTVPVYGDGANVRDWLFVDDHVAALDGILQRGRPGRTYNVGARAERPNLEIVGMLCDLLDELAPDRTIGPRRGLIKFVEDRPGHDRRYAIDPARLETELGWRPRHALEDGLRLTVAWYLEHRAWWEPIVMNQRREGSPGLRAAG